MGALTADISMLIPMEQSTQKMLGLRAGSSPEVSQGRHRGGGPLWFMKGSFLPRKYLEAICLILLAALLFASGSISLVCVNRCSGHQDIWGTRHTPCSGNLHNEL